MKRIFYLLFLVLAILLTGCDSTEVGTLYYEDDTIYYEGELKNDLPHGWGIAYDSGGNKFYEGTFYEGATDANGFARTYWTNGNLRFEGILLEAEFLEGDIYRENGSYAGYLAYPSITIIGDWVSKDMQDEDSPILSLTFEENGKLSSNANSSFSGEYYFENIDDDTRDADLIIKIKGRKGYTGGRVNFSDKDTFSMVNEFGEYHLYIREE